MARHTALVTGGTGSIGSVLVDKLLRDGTYDQVVVLCRNDSAAFNLAQQHRDAIRFNKLRIILGDVRNEALIHNIVTEGVHVFHCAALKHVYNDGYNAHEYTDVNVNGTYNVLHALRVLRS